MQVIFFTYGVLGSLGQRLPPNFVDSQLPKLGNQKPSALKGVLGCKTLRPGVLGCNTLSPNRSVGVQNPEP